MTKPLGNLVFSKKYDRHLTRFSVFYDHFIVSFSFPLCFSFLFLCLSSYKRYLLFFLETFNVLQFHPPYFLPAPQKFSGTNGPVLRHFMQPCFRIGDMSLSLGENLYSANRLRRRPDLTFSKRKHSHFIKIIHKDKFVIN